MGNQTKAEFFTDSIPNGWRKTVATSPDVKFGIDKNTKHSGSASGFIKREAGFNTQGSGTMLQSILADEYRGKRIKMSAYAKSDAVMRAGFYLRVDGPETALTFANTLKNSIEETTSWQLYQLILDVPEEARNIDFGAMLMQEGTLWVDDYKIEVIPKTGTTDNMTSEESKTRKLPVRNYKPNPKPVNLGFEDF